MYTNKIVCFSVGFALVFLGESCMSGQQKHPSDTPASSFSLVQPSDPWVNFINNSRDSVHLVYTDQAILFVGSSIPRIGISAIRDYYQSIKWTIDSNRIIYHTAALPDSTVVYQIGTFKTQTLVDYKFLRIWRMVSGRLKIELEFIAEAVDSGLAVIETLNGRRNDWMALCNKHEASMLVKELYSPGAYYYNHKPLIIGTHDISQEYRYMNAPKYNLHLDPIHVEAVNDTLVFEIGQGSGSYQGKYILIWQKTNSGKWMVMLDSNI